MTKYFEAKIKYRKTNEQGVQKVVTEAYLLDAISYSEAERRITEEVSANITGDFKVANIRVTNYSEVHSSDEADSWFKSKVSLIAFDDESGKEKKTNIYLLVQANDVKDANERTIEVMKGTMGDYTIPAISETSIVDFFPYFSGE
jgi:hypothetical protein